MIIDLILDRKDGKKYSAKAFYNDVSHYAQTFPFACNIADALDGGEEKDVKRLLCLYLINNGYNESLCNYVNSVSWLTDGDALESEPAEQLEAAKNIIIALLDELEENAPDYYALNVVLHADMWLRWYGKEGTAEELAKLREEIKKDY